MILFDSALGSLGYAGHLLWARAGGGLPGSEGHLAYQGLGWMAQVCDQIAMSGFCSQLMLTMHRSAKRFDEYFSSRSSIFFEFLNKALFMRDRLALPTFRKAWQILFKGDFSAHGHLLYEKHYSAIASSTPKDRLLYWTFNDGWEPLCKFLDQPIPDTPFPHLNTARALEEGMRSSHLLMAMQYALKVTSIAAYATLIMGLWRIFSV